MQKGNLNFDMNNGKNRLKELDIRPETGRYIKENLDKTFQNLKIKGIFKEKTALSKKSGTRNK